MDENVSRSVEAPEADETAQSACILFARRKFLLQSSALGANAGLMSLIPTPIRQPAWTAGSDKPELHEVKVGFMPLTDCASVVMASVLGFDRKHGIRITPVRANSWAAIRDKLVSGDLDAAHALYGMVYGVHLGIGSPREDMAVLMTLNNNGQGISVSRNLSDKGVTDGTRLAAAIAAEPRERRFAQTFPTGTHAMWLYYWLAAHGIDPQHDVRTITVPPPQMVATLAAGHIDGFCVGEPWNHYGIVQGASVQLATSQQVWPDHPEKVLGTTHAFAERNPNTARALVMALLEASRWIDASIENRRHMAQTIAGAAYVDVPAEIIVDRILGLYQDGLGRSWLDRDPLKFHSDGAVNFPYLSDGMWFMTQFRRWGLLDADPDYLSVARSINRTDLYREAAGALGIGVPTDPMRTSTLIDGAVWSGRHPEQFAQAPVAVA